MSPRVRSFLAAVLLLAALALLAGCRHDDEAPAAEEERTAPVQRFESRPDLRPPVVEVNIPARGTTPGYLLLAPKRGVEQAGPLILDDRGEVVWFRPLDTKGVADVRVQRYGGRPVLTWWRGRASNVGIGEGHFVIFDESYNQIATVSAGNGLAGDIHEFVITPRDTALFLAYKRMPYDLTPVGGPKQGKIFEGVVQEVDITTGEVLFEWHSIEHVGIEEGYTKAPPAERGAKAQPYDYFHVNSVSEDSDGDLLVSARNTRAIYKISRSDGRVVWRLGGKKSDFAMGPGTRFAWQHDARRQPDGTVTLFDNAAAPKVSEFSRVLVLDLDTERRRAILVRSYRHPKRLLAGSQGNAQFLANGHVLVGWGEQPYVTEFDRAGRAVLDLRFGAEGSDSYRAYRVQWTGRPADDPAVKIVPGETRSVLHVSWNGATEVTQWQVLAGATPQRLRPLGVFPKEGFETAITAQTQEPYLSVRALSEDGKVLGTSDLIALEDEAADEE